MRPPATAWRCFVAVPIGDELRARLVRATAAWRDIHASDDLRWTDPAAWHLTLAFVGATDPADVPRLAHAMAEAAAAAGSFELTTDDLGAFPSSRAARVAWLGVADPSARLGALTTAVRRAVGADERAPYRPHLTLARARSRPARLDLDAWREAEPAPIVSLVVDRAVLYRSRLGSGPARYEVLAEAPLGAAVHA